MMAQEALDRTTATRPQGPDLVDQPDAEGFTHARVDVGEVTLHVASVAGSENNAGPLVVFLHGFPEFWWSWRHQLRALAAAGYRVMAPDLRGYHLSDKPRGVSSYKVESLAADVAGLIRASGAPDAVVVGHDWGAMVAWTFAERHADLLRRLVIMNVPHPRAMLRGLLRPEQLKKSWYMFFFQLPFLPELMLTRDDAGEVVKQLRGASVDRSHFSEAELKPFRDAIQRPGAASAMVGWYRAAIRDGLRHPLTAPRYPSITVDTLLIWGMDDVALEYDVLVPGTERYVRHLDIKTLEGCGHFVQSERPDDVNRLLIDFLKR